MSIIIKEYQEPLILDKISYEDGTIQSHIEMGLINEKPFSYWYTGRSNSGCMRQAEDHWEERKRELYGSTTHIETIFNRAGRVIIDKYSKDFV